MNPVATHTHGGGIDQTAIIGHAPESRDWRPEHGTAGVELGTNIRVEAFCTIDAGLHDPTRIGARTWLMKRCHVGHDAQIGEDCELAPGTAILGHATVGDRVKIGGNAVLRPFIKVGDDARIGCGAVIVKDVPAGETWAGNPARRLA